MPLKWVVATITATVVKGLNWQFWSETESLGEFVQ